MSLLSELPPESARLVFDDVEDEIAPCVTDTLKSIGAYEHVVCYMAECVLSDVDVAPAIAIQRLGYWKAFGEHLAKTGHYPELSASDLDSLSVMYKSIRRRVVAVAV